MGVDRERYFSHRYYKAWYINLQGLDVKATRAAPPL